MYPDQFTHATTPHSFSKPYQSSTIPNELPPKDEEPPPPPLPKIQGEIILQVFTHKSLRPPAELNIPHDDNERLSEIGERAFEMVVSLALFQKRPLLTRDEILMEREEVMNSYKHFDYWVTSYGLRQRLRCMPEAHAKLASYEETRALFFAYVGGVFEEGGVSSIQPWVNQLLGIKSPDHPPQTPQATNIAMPSYMDMKTESLEEPVPIFFASQPPPSPARTQQYPTPSQFHYNPQQPQFTQQPYTYQQPQYQPSTPQYQSYQPPLQQQQSYSHQPSQPPPSTYQPQPAYSNPLTPAQPKLAFLPLFNQMAAQRRVKVEYLANFSGPSHAGRWSVQCVVNGISKGHGQGVSKQVAKDEAAREAYYAMGWT